MNKCKVNEIKSKKQKFKKIEIDHEDREFLKFKGELQEESLNFYLLKLSSENVRNLEIKLHDLEQIEKAFRNFMIHLFDNANKIPIQSRLIIEEKEVGEINEGLKSIKKIQELLSMVNTRTFDTKEVAVTFTRVNRSRLLRTI